MDRFGALVGHCLGTLVGGGSVFLVEVGLGVGALVFVVVLIERSERLQLMMILDNREAVLPKVMRDGLSEKSKPRQRLSIYKRLVEMTDKLYEKLKQELGNNTAEIDELFKGPN